jgi:DHA1 family tetracycline resistance protein-like MFS transporter
MTDSCPNQKFIILILMVTVVIDVMGVGLVFPILPDLFFAKHSALLATSASETMRYWAYATVMALWPLGLMLGGPFIGDVSDKIGRKKTLVSALVLTVVAYALGALAIAWHGFVLFAISRFLSGFVGGAFELAQATVADISRAENKARNLSYVVMAASLGFVIGPAITSFSASGLFAFHSLSSPFWIAAILAALNVLSIAVFLRESFIPHPEVKLNFFKAIKAVSFLFQDKRIRYLGLLFILMQAGWGFYVQSVPLILHHQYHLNIVHIGWFFSLMGASVMLSTLVVQPIVFKRFTLKSLYVVSITLTGLLLALNVLIPSLATEWIVVILASLIQIIGYGVIMTLFSNAVSEHEQGKVMGSAGAGFGASWVINALLIGALMSMDLYLPIIAAVLCFVVSGLALIRYRPAEVSDGST